MVRRARHGMAYGGEIRALTYSTRDVTGRCSTQRSSKCVLLPETEHGRPFCDQFTLVSDDLAEMARFGKPSVSQIIQKVVANDSATTELDFSGNSIYQMKSSEKTRELCDALVGSKHVTRVILQNCEIGDGEAAMIGEMLAKNQSIEELILKENKPLKDVRLRAPRAPRARAHPNLPRARLASA